MKLIGIGIGKCKGIGTGIGSYIRKFFPVNVFFMQETKIFLCAYTIDIS